MSSNTESTSSATGALKVDGGVGIKKDLFVGENLTVAGNLTITGDTTSVNTTNMSVTDSLVGLSSGTSGNPGNDSGFIINRGNASNVFMGWDETNDKFVLGTTNATETSTGALTMTGSSTLLANIQVPNNGTIGSVDKANAISITSAGVVGISTTTESSSTGTGALTVDGGVGIAKDLYVGDELFLKKDGAVLSMGAGDDFTITHDGNTGATIAANPLTITSATASTYSTTAGALTLDGAGGINIAGNASKVDISTS